MNPTLLPAGSYKVTAKYGGNSLVAASASAASTLTVAKDISATGLKLSAAAVTAGHENAEHVSVSVKAPHVAGVTGTVTVTAKAGGGKPVRVCVVALKSGKGSCALKAKALPAGSYTLTAVFAGSPGVLASTSPKTTLTVRK
jgi:hypothetical protein